MKIRFLQLFTKHTFTLRSIFILLILIALGVSLQQFFLPEREFSGVMHPHYNNYLIFKYSFPHLLNNLNLYTLHLTEYGDLFKYSPTFAFAMGLFYYLPNWLGLIIWNLLNTICLFIGIKMLPRMDERSKVFLLLFVLFELIGNLQNEQSNALITGFVLLTFVFFERRNMMFAALFVVLAFYVKIFGIVAAALFLLYPQKGRFLLYLGLWTVILGALPLLIVSPGELMAQYENWAELLKEDHGLSYGFSVMGVLHKWFGLDISKWLLIVIGVALFCVGYIRHNLFKDLVYRYLFLSSILIWIIIFNHKAESPTYIIAMAGIGIWFFAQKRTIFNTVLLALAFVFISFTLTDLFPREMRQFLYDYYIKAIPAILIWVMLIYQMVSGSFQAKNEVRS
ncbi:MAG: DUF2029 domain-containing protein [Bacteroidetes bacterium]|nr:MAG: DUF2029 domain-containing protein [Bacteroidota bacterium]